MIYHEAIVIGGGLAGLRAALELNRKNVKVGVVSKVHPVRSHSVAAQGGINGALGNHVRGLDDSWERHAFDTIKGSDYLADQNTVAKMAQDAPKRIIEMEHWGCPFSRTEEGKIAQRPFGGAGFPRTCYAADRTGHALLHTLYEQATKFKQAAERGEMVFYDEWLVASLVVEDGVCRGVIAIELATGRIEAFKADAVIFATGGMGRLYGNTTNALINTAMGMAVAFWAGAPLKDMEFVQFHPTTLYGSNILITEAARGEGGFLVNNKGERFLANYDDSKKAMEVSPRDIVARNMTKEIAEGRGFGDAYLHLDITHLGAAKIIERLPGIREISMKFAGVDPIGKPMPVQPGQHYTMGGIDVNVKCESRVNGFYAAGECACVSVHGANRLGGNSLLETIVFGAIAGESAGDYIRSEASPTNGESAIENALREQEDKISRLAESHGTTRPAEIKERLNRVMMDKVGIFRAEEQLREALEEVKELQNLYKDVRIQDSGRRLNYELVSALELRGSLDVAEAIVKGAFERQESRGSHFRTDYSKRDDENWLKHTLAFYDEEGVRLDYSDVDLSLYQPKERTY